MNILLLMMGGSGTRLRSKRPKQYLDVIGHPVFYYIIKKYSEMQELDRICIVSHVDWISFVWESMKDISFHCDIDVIPGGENRSASVRNGLHAVSDTATANDVILIHDATHPYVDYEGTVAVIQAVQEIGGATLGACQYDTCYCMDHLGMIKQVIPRQELITGASPEAFRFGDISKIYFNSNDSELAAMTSAGAIALAHNIPMKVIPTQLLNLKITYQKDLDLFRLLLNDYYFVKE